MTRSQRLSPPPPAHLGERLKRLAFARGHTVNSLALALDCSPQHVSRMLGGKKRFTPGMLGKYIAGLELHAIEAELHLQAAQEYGFKVALRR